MFGGLHFGRLSSSFLKKGGASLREVVQRPARLMRRRVSERFCAFVYWKVAAAGGDVSATAHMVMAHILMAYIVVADIVMAYIVMAYIVLAFIVMAMPGISDSGYQ